ncbi:hypothetical protein BaRGS_00011635, partial [Batillaria attramentaria]
LVPAVVLEVEAKWEGRSSRLTRAGELTPAQWIVSSVPYFDGQTCPPGQCQLSTHRKPRSGQNENRLTAGDNPWTQEKTTDAREGGNSRVQEEVTKDGSAGMIHYRVILSLRDSTRRVILSLWDSTRRVILSLRDSTRHVILSLRDSTPRVILSLRDSVDTPRHPLFAGLDTLTSRLIIQHHYAPVRNLTPPGHSMYGH